MLRVLVCLAGRAGGCGYRSNGMTTGTRRGSATTTINATSGGPSVSTAVSLTVQ